MKQRVLFIFAVLFSFYSLQAQDRQQVYRVKIDTLVAGSAEAFVSFWYSPTQFVAADKYQRAHNGPIVMHFINGTLFTERRNFGESYETNFKDAVLIADSVDLSDEKRNRITRVTIYLQ